VPAPKVPFKLVLPAPVTVSVAVLFVMLPPKTNKALALVDVIVGVPAAVKVMGLFKVSVVAAAVESVSAAVPVNVKVLVLASVAPLRFNPKVDAVATEIVPPVAPPSAFVLVALSVPALIVVLPV